MIPLRISKIENKASTRQPEESLGEMGCWWGCYQSQQTLIFKESALFHQWFFQKKHWTHQQTASTVLMPRLISYTFELMAEVSKVTLKFKKTVVFLRKTHFFIHDALHRVWTHCKKEVAQNIDYMLSLWKYIVIGRQHPDARIYIYCIYVVYISVYCVCI